METQNFGAGLRYVDVEELEPSNAGLMVGAEIRDRNDAKVGELDGFVVDAVTGRPKYAVIEAGGWFKSERYLLPIAHLDVAPDGNCTIDIARSAIEGYPEFDESFACVDSDKLARPVTECAHSALVLPAIGVLHHDTSRPFDTHHAGMRRLHRNRNTELRAGSSASRTAQLGHGPRADRRRWHGRCKRSARRQHRRELRCYRRASVTNLHTVTLNYCFRLPLIR